ncbi:hypothetical protein [Sharpea azabuensis]|uniref:hypothetical protein n=1 Tax=Sharpea azabuensis TaxID=322505 RepID=UPI001563B9DD|nr:hypothetical protein [Sharpea azabuensis]
MGLKVNGIQLTLEQEAAWKAFDSSSFQEAIEEEVYDEDTHTLKDVSFLPEEWQDDDPTNSPFDIVLKPSGGYFIQ